MEREGRERETPAIRFWSWSLIMDLTCSDVEACSCGRPTVPNTHASHMPTVHFLCLFIGLHFVPACSVMMFFPRFLPPSLDNRKQDTVAGL